MLLTFTAFDGMIEEPEPDELPVLAAGAELTSIETSVKQTPPEPFHTFTCRVCQPLGARGAGAGSHVKGERRRYLLAIGRAGYDGLCERAHHCWGKRQAGAGEIPN